MSNSNIILREASASDLEIITQYTIKLHQHEDDGKIKPHQNFAINLKKWLSSGLADPRSLFLIATQNDAPIGFIGATSIINDNGFLAHAMKGNIQLIWVEPDHRKKGVAEKLVDEIEHCFKEIGIDYVECSYTATNHLAEVFWSNNGYEKNSVTARKFL